MVLFMTWKVSSFWRISKSSVGGFLRQRVDGGVLRVSIIHSPTAWVAGLLRWLCTIADSPRPTSFETPHCPPLAPGDPRGKSQLLQSSLPKERRINISYCIIFHSFPSQHPSFLRPQRVEITDLQHQLSSSCCLETSGPYYNTMNFSFHSWYL